MGGLKNLTPHKISIISEGNKVEIEPSGLVVRITTNEKYIGDITIGAASIPVVRQELKDLAILKDGKELSKAEIVKEFQGVWGVVVSMPVAMYAKELRQLIGEPELVVYTPNTAKAIRDTEGRIIGVPSLVEW